MLLPISRCTFSFLEKNRWRCLCQSLACSWGLNVDSGASFILCVFHPGLLPSGYPERAQCLWWHQQKEAGGHLLFTCNNQDNADFLVLVLGQSWLAISASFPPFAITKRSQSSSLQHCTRILPDGASLLPHLPILIVFGFSLVFNLMQMIPAGIP